ncbi:hypothetical protein GCM10017771_52110 [Streptomyces capitiformicae]|uniref:Uncharacterized protein n=1 Tax=Streptomyces capitiformicae TaxID=2014920 RepID=A0A919DD57_9ACTN|nr:hypothetical protein GCM10017771_52110 [Streptomyces capitiformicae]
MEWARFVIVTAVVLYLALALFRYARNPATSLGDAFTPRWLQRVHGRRIMNRQREEYLRARADQSRDR